MVKYVNKFLFLLFLFTSTILISCGKEPVPIPTATAMTDIGISLTPHQMGSNWEGNLGYSTRLALKDKGSRCRYTQLQNYNHL